MSVAPTSFENCYEITAIRSSGWPGLIAMFPSFCSFPFCFSPVLCIPLILIEPGSFFVSTV